MLSKIKHIIIGDPLPTHQLAEKRLNKVRALAAFSPDALSSIAYANQEIYLGLILAGTIGLGLAWPIGLVITFVLIIVSISYYQTIHAYPSGGGSYIVARSNLGTAPGLVAASALLMDYLLTAAVSLAACVDALASAFPSIWEHRTLTCLALLLILTLINLRGLRETGTVMAIPVYLFLFTYLTMLAYGLFRFSAGSLPPASTAPPPALEPLTVLLVLHAFASGCTALTGIEAISNGVPAFRPPESRNAGQTLIVMAVLMGSLFLGSIGLTQALGVVAGSQETILSALARRILGTGFPYYLIQFATMLILAVAANTSFAGFPRVVAILAKDGFLPRQLVQVGDRLVFANGIVLLSAATALLLIVFSGDTHSLVPLFAVGAFLAFTLSQSGMVAHWWRERGMHWRSKMFMNGLGALATGTTLIVVAVGKFVNGAWITILVIPLLVIVFWKIRNHYRQVAAQLTLKGIPPSIRPAPTPRVVIPISGVHRGIVDAVDFAQAITRNVTALYIELEPGSGSHVKEIWERWWPDIPLVIRPSPYRSIIGPLIEFLDETDRIHNDGQLATVILPEFVPAQWWHAFLHNQSSWLIKTALLYKRREKGYQRVIIDIPYHLKR
jgi:amino acid transporter